MREPIGSFAPRARSDNLIVKDMGDELLVYDPERFQAHSLNDLASRVWRLSDGIKSVSQIASALKVETGSPVDVHLIWLTIDQLAKARLLNEDQTAVIAGRLSRRDLLVRLGVGAAVALPVVTSLVAPKAAQASTCLSSGSTCSTGAQCCSGVCNVTTCV